MSANTQLPTLLELRREPIEGTKYHLIHYDQLPIDVRKVETSRNAKYLGEFTVKAKDGSWANKPVAVFYQKEYSHPQGSNYFGLFISNSNQLMITDAKIVEEHTWTGVLDRKTNDILYSAFRHDFQEHEGLMADGGPEYTRSSSHPTVYFKIINGEIKVTYVEEECEFYGY